MKNTVVYIHGKGGSAQEAEHYEPLFPAFSVIGFDYRAQTPWEAKEEFPAYLAPLRRESTSLILVANSIGAYFSMHALEGCGIDRAFFISPVADMEKLILDMMGWAGVSEEELREKNEIPTPFGETLSWPYLCYVRAHPPRWTVPTGILYGGKDALISRETVSAFAARTGAGLTVMENGEHWFHTEEQMAFLDAWIRRSMRVYGAGAAATD